jgi:hypothetical protein
MSTQPGTSGALRKALPTLVLAAIAAALALSATAVAEPIVTLVTKRMFGKRLFLKIAARTPKARAVALRSVSLPRLR